MDIGNPGFPALKGSGIYRKLEYRKWKSMISKLYTHVPYEKTQYKKIKWDQTGPLCRKTSPWH